MGWGDEIMVTAQARRLQERLPGHKIAVVDRWEQRRWHPIWEHNPRILKPSEPCSPRVLARLANYPGHRPYLDYARFNNSDKAQRYVYTGFRVEPGEIYLTPEERALGERLRGRVILEPHVKARASPNKGWGWARWERLAAELRDLDLAQLGPRDTPTLPGVDLVETADVRKAAGALSGAALLIAPEGGLHHAAAALGVRAVVIFGGFISPATTGYDLHVNLFTGGEACGMRLPCAHCDAAMARITPEEVAAHARAQLARLELAA